MPVRFAFDQSLAVHAAPGEKHVELVPPQPLPGRVHGLVDHFDEKESLRRRGHDGRDALAAFEQRRDVRGRELAQPDVHQGTGEAAHHLVEKTVGFERERHLPPAALDLHPAQIAHGGLIRAVVLAGERPEIVFPTQQLCGFFDFRPIQVAVQRPAVGHVEGIRLPEVEVVAIDFSFRVEARMKIGARDAERLQLNRPRQPGLQRPPELLRAVRPSRVEVKNLRVGMNAGVGPSTAFDANLLSENLPQLPLDQVLDRVPTLLALPAIERRAIIGDDALPADWLAQHPF